MLHSDFIIRRLKKDVLPQLPAFCRQVIDLECPTKADFKAALEIAEEVCELRSCAVLPSGHTLLSAHGTC